MASYYTQPYNPRSPPPASAQNLQFYPSHYGGGGGGGSVSGHTTPSQASYGGYGPSTATTASAYPGYGAGSSGGFGGGVGGVGGSMGVGVGGVSGRMGEQGGLRTGWLAAFGTEGYEGEPGLMEELGVNFGHIKTKVRKWTCLTPIPPKTFFVVPPPCHLSTSRSFPLPTKQIPMLEGRGHATTYEENGEGLGQGLMFRASIVPFPLSLRLPDLSALSFFLERHFFPHVPPIPSLSPYRVGGLLD